MPRHKYITTLFTSPDKEDAWNEAHKLAAIIVQNDDGGRLGVRVALKVGIYQVELWENK